jgi:hypothetical protein
MIHTSLFCIPSELKKLINASPMDIPIDENTFSIPLKYAIFSNESKQINRLKKTNHPYPNLPIKFLHISLIKVTFTKQLSMTFIQFDVQGNSFLPEHKLQ